MKYQRGNRADISESLYRHARALEGNTKVLATAGRGIEYSAARGFVAAERSSEARTVHSLATRVPVLNQGPHTLFEIRRVRSQIEFLECALIGILFSR